MNEGETEKQMVQRHVASGARTIEAQETRIKHLIVAGLNTESARELLATFLDSQGLHLDHLARL